MRNNKKIKVLIVDDSLFFREYISRELSKDENFEIIGTAGDAYEAKEKISLLSPDVVTLDVEMPKMNGIDFLKELIPQKHVPVVVISAVSENVFDALNAGAVDFITKPQPGRSDSMRNFTKELFVKIKIASIARVKSKDEIKPRKNVSSNIKIRKGKFDFIAIGASTGGTEAIISVVKELPCDFPGIVIVQHMPPGFTELYAQRLNRVCKMSAKEARNLDEILPGQIIVAAGEYHMTVKKTGGRYFIESKKGQKVNGHCPSVDVMFESISKLPFTKTIGIILTGMGSDGAKGLLAMKNSGALTIGQSEENCVVFGMPKVARDIGALTHEIHISTIKDQLLSALE